MSEQPGIQVIAQPEDILPDPGDDREPVLDTLVSPFSSVCRIGAFKDESSTEVAFGTGWIVNPLTVVTAGHVVFHSHFSSTGEAAYAKKIVVKPAYNERGGVTEEYMTGTALAHEVFISTGSVDFDFAVVKFSASFPTRFPPLAYYSVDDVHLIGQNGFVAGFPKDRKDGREMVSANGRVVGVDQQRIMHQIDTVAGQSGAPLWVQDTAGNPVVVGVHVDGFRARPVNTAVRISALVKQWIDQQTLRNS